MNRSGAVNEDDSHLRIRTPDRRKHETPHQTILIGIPLQLSDFEALEAVMFEELVETLGGKIAIGMGSNDRAPVVARTANGGKNQREGNSPVGSSR